MKQFNRMWPVTVLLVALCPVISTMSALADDETMAAGNGGACDCSANGGALAAGDVNSGADVGATIGIGDTLGSVDAGGGAMAKSTDLSASLDGGTGVCAAPGADENIAFTIEPTPSLAPVTAPPAPPAPASSPATVDSIEEAEFRCA
jgi:hypothetical protein